MVKKIFTLVAMLLSLAASAQRTLVADETWIVESSFGNFKVITYNDSVANMIYREFGHVRLDVSWTKKFEKRHILYFRAADRRCFDAFLQKIN